MLVYSMTVKLQIDQHLEFLNLRGSCTVSSEATFVKCHVFGNHMSWLNYYYCGHVAVSVLCLCFFIAVWCVCCIFA